MQNFEVFESAMLVCFSISWYWSIAKMLQTKTATGKSLTFVLMICLGYLVGISSKIAAWQEVGQMSPVIGVYVWNLLITIVDAALVIHFSRPVGHHDAVSTAEQNWTVGLV